MNRIHTAVESHLDINLADPAIAAYLCIRIIAHNCPDAFLLATRHDRAASLNHVHTQRIEFSCNPYLLLRH